jgi:hypothetical protein
MQLNSSEYRNKWNNTALSESFATLLPVVSEYLKKEYGFEIHDAPDFRHRTALGFSGNRLDLSEYVSVELKTYISLHLFGVAVQLAECLDARERDQAVARICQTRLDHRGNDRPLILFDQRATEYAAQVLVELNKSELIPWLSALAVADRLFAEDQLTKNGTKGFNEFRAEVTPAPLTPRPIPSVTLQSITTRYAT